MVLFQYREVEAIGQFPAPYIARLADYQIITQSDSLKMASNSRFREISELTRKNLA